MQINLRNHENVRVAVREDRKMARKLIAVHFWVVHFWTAR